MVKINNICIIKNHKGFDENKWNKEYITDFTNIYNYVNNYVSYDTVNDINEFENIIIKYLINENNFNVQIKDIYYTQNYVYQGLFIISDDIDDNNEKYIIQNKFKHSDKFGDEYNKLATQIIGDDNIKIISNLIIIKRNINNNHSYSNIEFNDIFDIINFRFIKKYILCKANNDIYNLQIERDKHVLLNFGEQLNKNELMGFAKEVYNIKDIIKYVIIFYVNKNVNKNINNLNKKASLLYGEAIYGDVILTLDHRIQFNENGTTGSMHPEYIYLDDKIFNKLVYLHCIKYINNDIKFNINDHINNNNDNNDKNLCNMPNLLYSPNIFSIIDKEYNKNKYLDINIDECLNKIEFNTDKCLNDYKD